MLASHTEKIPRMDAFEQALAAVEREDWPAAETALCEVVATRPDFADALHLLGLSLWHQGRVAEAEPRFRAAHDLAPHFPPSCFYLAATLVVQGDPVGALPWLEKFTELSPADPNGWLRLGEVLLGLLRNEDAVEKLTRAMELAPETTEVRCLLARAQFNARRFSACLDTLEPLAGQNRLDPDSLRLLCRAAEECEEYARAVPHAVRLAEASPANVDDCRMAARIRFAAGDEEAGLAEYRRSLELRGIAPEDRCLLPVRIVTTETWEIIASRWVSLGLPDETVLGERIRPSLTRHDRATVLVPEWLVVTHDHAVLVEQMVHNPKTLRGKSERLAALTRQRGLLDLPAEAQQIVEACALIGGSTDYYHWLVDYLPRVGILAKSADLRGLPLLVNADLAPFQRESLTAIGFGPERLIPLPPGTVAQCRVLWVPTLVSRVASFHPFVAGWLRRMYLTKAMKQAPRRRLFLSRPDATQHRLDNEAELIEQLRPLGFEVIEPGRMGFIEQVAAFSVAEIVVGPHGPELANTIFSPPDVRILELGFPQYPAAFFRNIAGQLSQKFARINGEALPTDSPLPHTWNFRIDIDAVVRAIATAPD